MLKIKNNVRLDRLLDYGFVKEKHKRNICYVLYDYSTSWNTNYPTVWYTWKRTEAITIWKDRLVWWSMHYRHKVDTDVIYKMITDGIVENIAMPKIDDSFTLMTKTFGLLKMYKQIISFDYPRLFILYNEDKFYVFSDTDFQIQNKLMWYVSKPLTKEEADSLIPTLAKGLVYEYKMLYDYVDKNLKEEVLDVFRTTYDVDVSEEIIKELKLDVKN